MSEKRVQVTLPYPPSVNHMYTHTARGVFMSEAGKAFKLEARCCVSHHEWRFLLGTPLAVTMHIYRPRKAGDIDNRVKLILDSMNDVLWVDDSQICELHVYRHDDKQNPRIELEVVGL